MSKEIPTYHIWHDTPEGRLPFTYFVFGPYGDRYDVEVYRGHHEPDDRPIEDFLGTANDLRRNTHIVIDVWDKVDELVGVTA